MLVMTETNSHISVISVNLYISRAANDLVLDTFLDNRDGVLSLPGY